MLNHYSESPAPTRSPKLTVTFLQEGTHEFTLKSDAAFRIYASPYTHQYGLSAFQYPSCEDRFNPPSKIPAWARTSLPRPRLYLTVSISSCHTTLHNKFSMQPAMDEILAASTFDELSHKGPTPLFWPHP
ncbi:hypothetical protein K469DRAFT_717356 [Zopfia rhizophila CBS 207.26]|uniref:Uncharacterized protein n=1 Tax=Zopfia rhizophila CBS 207.26 TaxID=1314779 RepID=A0A6A6ENK9_9PEZI|nr:hypothetical protein K469DRAFT_717356 [Zopfia rhizophila CBS 207.26]